MHNVPLLGNEFDRPASISFLHSRSISSDYAGACPLRSSLYLVYQLNALTCCIPKCVRRAISSLCLFEH